MSQKTPVIVETLTPTDNTLIPPSHKLMIVQHIAWVVDRTTPEKFAFAHGRIVAYLVPDTDTLHLIPAEHIPDLGVWGNSRVSLTLTGHKLPDQLAEMFPYHGEPATLETTPAGYVKKVRVAALAALGKRATVDRVALDVRNAIHTYTQDEADRLSKVSNVGQLTEGEAVAVFGHGRWRRGIVTAVGRRRAHVAWATPARPNHVCILGYPADKILRTA